MPSPNSSLILRQVKGSKLTIAEMDGDLLYLAQTLSSSDGTGVIQVTGSSFDASNTNLTGSGLSLLNITNVAQTDVLSYDYTTGQVYYVNTGSIGRLPAPSNTYIQYNSGSDFGADSSFRFIYTIQSLQQGNNTAASGAFSHAEGTLTRVTNTGYASHAEGELTLVSGYAAHAEGSLTTASGDYSHTEGQQTIALGLNSHAEGSSSLASGVSSHAEGNGTIASGSHSHAEGISTTAKGTGTHAEGRETTAFGQYSHAEGQQTVSSGSYSHAEGQETTARGNYSHAEGYQTYASGNYSHAEGSRTLAIGIASHAEGEYTTASGNYSHAGGRSTITSGSYQSVIGQYNISSTSQSAFIIGDGVDDSNRHNILFVSQSHFEVSASNLFFQGLDTSAQPNVLTYDPTTGQVYYTASGNVGGATPPAPSDTFIQYNSGSSFGAINSFRFIYTSQSLQQGSGVTAFGFYSHAQGSNTIAYGNYSHAEGLETLASGFYSHTEGASTTASKDYAHAEGEGTLASGDASHAEGYQTYASGAYSHAEGRSTTASGNYSHAAGRETIASGSYQSVIGQWNVASTSQSAFIIGDGTNSSNRHNVLFVSQSHFEADAPNTYFKNLGTTAQSNVLTYNSSTGQLFYAASSSLIVTNALTASYVTSSNIVGTVTSASYAATASFTSNMRASSASVASFVPAGGGDYISNQIFFSPQFPNNNYAITITGEDARSWTIQSKESASFVINTNSSVALSGPVYWIAMQFNS